MKIKFDATLQYQKEAIKAVTDLFKGQAHKRALFTVAIENIETDNAMSIGVGNKLELDNEEILENLREVQERNKIVPSKELRQYTFDVEMETGTGKTYVYLRTIFELNQQYSFA
ncbi:MAG: hypothetical protein ATN33_05335 [Epulopiscium sp. Nele67-Bin001]|nr:MAG: hypothetical protein ATN33_05335 [Epulopiscium sp. Nele67-Bin001]